jgi:lactobin A/cerein 7B family class IIb bacteriocin
MLTMERANMISDYLSQDAERTKELFNLMPSEAVEKINADGFDFTVEEITEYGENLKKIADKNGNGELDANELDDVSGGLATAAIVAIYGAVALGGFGTGVCAYKGWW